MPKTGEYRGKLRELDVWDDYLLAESGLPGPRGNLELAQAAADEGNEELFLRYSSFSASVAPANSPYEFLAFCGVVGMGRLAAEGRMDFLPTLRRFASDPRWRIREAVAMALQRLGDANMEVLLVEMDRWSRGAPLEQRAAAAALCEPRLLREPRFALAALEILDTITASVTKIHNRRDEDFLVLRQGLGYCWSVAAAALPSAGLVALEKWLVSEDKDVRWIMRENLKKNRLARAAPVWTAQWRASLAR